MTGDIPIDQVMRSIGLSHRTSILTSQGVDDSSTLGAFTANELKDIGVEKLGERVKMLIAARTGFNSVPLPAKEDLKSFFDKEEALSEYYARVAAAGIDSIALLGMITETDMEQELDMKPGHRKKLLLRLKERNAGRLSASPPPPASMPPLHVPSVSPIASPTMGTTRHKSATQRLNLSTVSEDDPQPKHDAKPLSRSWGLSSIDEAPVIGRKSPRTGHARTNSLQLYDSAKIFGTSSSTSDILEGSGDSIITSRMNRSSTTTRAFSTRSPGRGLSSYSMPDQRPDNSKRVVHSRRPSQLNDFMRKGYSSNDTGAEKGLLIKVFTNGRILDESNNHLLYKVISLKPREMRDIQIVYNVITRALGWNNSRASIYRQGNDAAGSCEVGKLWQFNGKPITSPDDFSDNMWVVAGTANSGFQGGTGEAIHSSGVDHTVKGSSKATSWADRLSNPEFFTGTQKGKHSAAVKSGRSGGGTRPATQKSLIKARMLDVRKQVAADAKKEPGVSTPTQTTQKQLPYTDPPKSTSAFSSSSNGRQHTKLTPTSPRPTITPPRSNTEPITSNGWPEGESSSNTDIDQPVSFNSQEDLESLGPKDLESANKGRLKGWKKGALLGRGSFGMVYRGTLADGLETAVKIVNLGEGRATAELQQLIREIRFIEQLEHPHIVKYYGCLFDEQQGHVEIFLQLMTGGSIASLTYVGVAFEETFLMCKFLPTAF
eukprot:TRINITY_DN4329_c0_g1_i2.p1 TRINITY_DN4329_c0_g1~~TRINITY_DN4329_c0_g1_i2.p1  ORF type:complete len:715 (+),score=197.48 TRINITY_DN4329_c0_g1_i2:128-2272(+)